MPQRNLAGKAISPPYTPTEGVLCVTAITGAPVAPVGLAFQRALAKRPTLAMLCPDKEHESIQGTYLAANVIYATLFGESPKGFKYYPTGVSAEEAAFLQRIAWQTVQAWRKQQPIAGAGLSSPNSGFKMLIRPAPN